MRLAGVELEVPGEAPVEDDIPAPPTLATLGEDLLEARHGEVDGDIPTPQTGISIPMVATPRLIRAVPEEAELLYTPPETLFDDIVRAEAERISQPEGVRNRIVYDSVGDPFKPEISPPPFGQDAWRCFGKLFGWVS